MSSHQPDTRPIPIRLGSLAWPIIGINVLTVLALAVDTAMCGRLPDADTALTGLGFATQLTFLLMVAMIGLTVGTVANVARAHGAGHDERINHVLLQATQLTLVLGVFGMLVGHGLMNLGPKASGAALFEILDASNPFLDMLLGALLAYVVASALALTVGKVGPAAIGKASLAAVKPVLHALAVLYLAWNLGSLIKQTNAAPFVASLLEGNLAPELLPLVTFVLAGATAFSTGSSYFTMGTLIPLVLPVALQIDPEGSAILLASTAAVLDGAVLGDHVSPISDTTILSSLGSGVDLVTHVRTQMPYALSAGAIAALVCTLPAGFGLSPWLLLPAGIAACIAVVLLVGRPHRSVQGPTAPAGAPQ